MAKEPPNTLKAFRPKRKDSFFTYSPARPRYWAIPSSRSSGVMEYWGKVLWKKRALATLERDMTDKRRSSLFGIVLATHLIASFIALRLRFSLFCTHHSTGLQQVKGFP